MNNDGNQEVIEAIQLHERAWGSDNYPQRPSLQKLLSAKVIVFWNHGKDDRWRATCHEGLADVQAVLTKMLLRAHIAPPKQSIARIYGNGRRICIKGVKVRFGYCEE